MFQSLNGKFSPIQFIYLMWSGTKKEHILSSFILLVAYNWQSNLETYQCFITVIAAVIFFIVSTLSSVLNYCSFSRALLVLFLHSGTPSIQSSIWNCLLWFSSIWNPKQFWNLTASSRILMLQRSGNPLDGNKEIHRKKPLCCHLMISWREELGFKNMYLFSLWGSPVLASCQKRNDLQFL